MIWNQAGKARPCRNKPSGITRGLRMHAVCSLMGLYTAEGKCRFGLYEKPWQSIQSQYAEGTFRHTAPRLSAQRCKMIQQYCKQKRSNSCRKSRSSPAQQVTTLSVGLPPTEPFATLQRAKAL